MKNLIFLILVIATLSCKAQSPIISMVDYENNDDIELTENCYLKDVENKFQPYIGTWYWSQGNSNFTIVFEKIEMAYSIHSQTYSDYLVGKYKYVQDGVEIVNTLNVIVDASNLLKNSRYIIDGSDYTEDTFQYLDFFDQAKNKSCNASIELTEYLDDLQGNISATKAQWKLSDKERTIINGENQTPIGFSVPTDIELTKQ